MIPDTPSKNSTPWEADTVKHFDAELWVHQE